MDDRKILHEIDVVDKEVITTLIDNYIDMFLPNKAMSNAGTFPIR